MQIVKNLQVHVNIVGLDSGLLAFHNVDIWGLLGV